MSETPEEKLKDANENPWYVLATVFGEQTGGEIDYDLARKNRSVWNAWALDGLSDEAKEAFYESLPAEFDQRVIKNVKDMPDWRRHVENAFEERFREYEEIPPIPQPTEPINFSIVMFRNLFSLSGYIFSGDVFFSSAEVQSRFDGDFCVFRCLCLFTNATFQYSLDLDHSLFEGGSSFQRVRGTGLLARGAIFQSGVPIVTQETSFGHVQMTPDEANWPSFTGDTINAGAKPYYVSLRRMMADRQDTDMEHFFYRQEMRCVIALEKSWLKRLPYQAFRLFSDFGHSIARPIHSLAGLWLAMTFVYALGFMFGAAPSSYSIDTALARLELFGFSAAYSLTNTFAFLGFRGLYLEEIVRAMDGWVQVMSAVQTTFSFGLLFCLALALRNRFRLS